MINKGIEINTIDDILNQIVGLYNDDYELYYRGQRNGVDNGWLLLPSLLRQSTFTTDYRAEKNDIECFVEKEPASRRENIIDQLNLLQHHSYPTRLLDLTKSPLVALKFALIDCMDLDEPVLYVILIKKGTKKSSRYVCQELDNYYESGNIPEDLSFVNANLSNDNIKNQVGDFVLFYKPVDISKYTSYRIYELPINPHKVEYLSLCCDLLLYDKNKLYPTISNAVTAVSGIGKNVAKILDVANDSEKEIKTLNNTALKERKLFDKVIIKK